MFCFVSQAKFNENQRLRDELSKCLEIANDTVQPLAVRGKLLYAYICGYCYELYVNYDLLTSIILDQGAENAEELQVNHEFEKMIYEDYRSQVCELDKQEVVLQAELATFSGWYACRKFDVYCLQLYSRY